MLRVSVPARGRVVEVSPNTTEKVCRSNQRSSAATSVLKIVTLTWTHMASPVTRVSVPNTILTAPAMNGMIGGRPSTHSVTASESSVEKISAHVPATTP